MTNIIPSKPSFVFGYWRPWKENSNFFDSYLDYSRDTSLVKYGADTVGQYISQASKEQVHAINQLGQAIGRGMNVLSNQMSDINESLVFLNRNMDVQIEQQKLSNLLLQNIAELLRVPDSEKERQHSIELGIKFFVNASKDPDLYTDALEELLKAEILMKQDYFVLHRIGCIYLYAEKYINPEKALDYFLRAAKYASVESDSNAAHLVSALTRNTIIEVPNQNDSFRMIIDDVIKKKGRGTVAMGRIETGVINTGEAVDILGMGDTKLSSIVTGVEIAHKILDRGEKGDSVGLLLRGIEVFEIHRGMVICKPDSTTINCDHNNSDNSEKQIGLLAADSYEKAAFAAYILGRFSDAVNYQSKALKFNDITQNRFLLAKYQVRNGEISEGVKNLNLCIDQEPVFAIAAFKVLDLINEPEVLQLISNKNQEIDNKINKLRDEWEKIESTEALKVIKELTELSQKSYEIKISQFKAFEKKANEINKDIGATESEIDAYISEIKKTTFVTFDENAIQLKIDALIQAKDLPIEKMIEVFDSIKKELEDDRLKIGSKYAGGIVFYIDKSGNHGLVCAEKDFEEAVWEGNVRKKYECFGAIEDGISNGHGMRNTKLIVEKASWNIQEGFFRTTKTPAPTAARLCLESNHNGFTDWYLPTLQELEMMYQTLEKNNLGTFIMGTYWSSTEYVYYGEGIMKDNCSFGAWNLDFNSGFVGQVTSLHNPFSDPLSSAILKKFSVRAVRAFNIYLNRLASLVRRDIYVDFQKRASSAGITCTINSFDLLHKGGQEYSGILKTIEGDEEYTYQVAVTLDSISDNIKWEIVE